MSNQSVAGTTADPTVEFTPLVLKGKTYQLLYDLNALAVAKQKTGRNFLFGLNVIDADAVELRGLLYAGLLAAHPDITEDEVGRMVTAKNLVTVAKALSDAFKANEMEEEKGENPTQPTVAAAE